MHFLRACLIVSSLGSRYGNGLNVAILGLYLFSDVIHDVAVFLIIQQLITSNLHMLQESAAALEEQTSTGSC